MSKSLQNTKILDYIYYICNPNLLKRQEYMVPADGSYYEPIREVCLAMEAELVHNQNQFRYERDWKLWGIM